MCPHRYLIIENFIPPEEKNKIMNRLTFDPEEDQWKCQPLVAAERSVCGENGSSLMSFCSFVCLFLIDLLLVINSVNPCR